MTFSIDNPSAIRGRRVANFPKLMYLSTVPNCIAMAFAEDRLVVIRNDEMPETIGDTLNNADFTQWADYNEPLIIQNVLEEPTNETQAKADSK